MPEPGRSRSAQASRANGARSRGPSSAAGKQIASQNARKHGLRAAAPAHGAADAQWLQALTAALQGDGLFDPERDHDLIERVVTAAFLMRRAHALFAQRAAELAVAPLKGQKHARRSVGLTLGQIRSLVFQKRRAGVTLAEVDALIDECFAARAAAKAPLPPSSDAIAAALEQLAAYERPFRGQRDRALKTLLRRRST